MDQSVLEMAKELVQAQIQAGHLSPEAMPQALSDTHAQLITLRARGESGASAASSGNSGPINWRKSITQHVITCLECGAVFKQLSIRHLRKHDLTARSYRVKYGIPQTLPLAAKATTAKRRKIVQVTRPWEKTPRAVEAKRGKTAAKKSVAKKAGKKTAAKGKK